MTSRFARSFFIAFTGVALATSLWGQDPQRGWRKFGDPPNDQSAQQQQQPQPPPSPYTTYAPQLTIPAGTWITVRLNQPLSSDHNQVGDTFAATLAQPIVVNGLVVARRGQTVGGRVSEVQKAGRVKGTSMLGFELMEITLADGQQLPIRTQLMEYGGGTSKGRDATAIGVTTGTGAAIGAAAAGGYGAGIGAAAGAAASAIGVLVTRGRATEIQPETPVTFRILQPLTFSTERSEQAFQPARQDDHSTQLQERTRQRAPNYGYGGYYPPYPPYWYGPGLWGPGWGGGGWWGPSVVIRTGPRYGYYRGWRRW